MKGYILLLLLAALLLLVIPLPAHRATLVPPAEPPPSLSEPPPTTDSSNDEPSVTEGVFKILCGNEVVTLSEREFLIRTLAAEMSPTYHSEALKAQAVAAYTYYGRRRTAQEATPDEALQGAHFVTGNERFPADYTTEALQKRWGKQYQANYEKLCAAVDAVLGRAMTYEDTYIDACYFSISNGCTESAKTVWGTDIPYLQAVASPGDRLAPGFQSTVTLTAEQVRTAMSTADPAVTLPEDPATWFGTPTLSEAGTVISIPVGDTALPGTQIRTLMGLRSATFTVDYADGNFTFTVCGYGHGVGMSQYGADYLARQGYTWEEILHYYYTGVTII